jgi:hypothetical protein
MKAQEALEFLRNHPALCKEGEDSICDGIHFMMEPCCKHGLSHWAGKTGVTYYEGSDEWSKYPDIVAEEYKDDTDSTLVGLRQIDVPYERVYGEPWAYDHMEYWYEITFFVFIGNPYEKLGSYKPENWGAYGGPHGGANTFEDMLIAAADDVKKVYGDFDSYSDEWLLPEEQNSHKTTPLFFDEISTSPTILGDKTITKKIIFNQDYISVEQGLINLRWLKWFITTDYAKTEWDFSIPEWQGYINKMETEIPESRKKILAKFKT